MYFKNDSDLFKNDSDLYHVIGTNIKHYREQSKLTQVPG